MFIKFHCDQLKLERRYSVNALQFHLMVNYGEMDGTNNFFINKYSDSPIFMMIGKPVHDLISVISNHIRF